jgi:hypothetical protein
MKYTFTILSLSVLLVIVLVHTLVAKDSTADISSLKQDIFKYSILLQEYKAERLKDHDELIQFKTELGSLGEKVNGIETKLNNLDTKIDKQILITKKEDKFDYQFFGIVFSVAIAALSLSWNIFNAVKQNSSKITLDCSFQQQILENGINVQVVEPVLSLSIVNHGQKSKYIERPFFKFNEKIDGYDTFIAVNLNKLQSYPVKLQPGARKEFKFDILSINDSIFEKNNKIKNLKVIAPDTYGKLYKSRKFKKKRFMDTIEVYNNTKQSS